MQDAIKNYVERAGKEKILLYFILLVCGALLTAVEAFSIAKYFGIYLVAGYHPSFFIQLSVCVFGCGTLGLLALVLLDGGRLVVWKERLYKIPGDILALVWLIFFEIVQDMASDMMVSGVDYLQGYAADGGVHLSLYKEVIVTVVTAAGMLPFVWILANTLMVLVLQVREGMFKEKLWLKKPCAKMYAWMKERERRRIERKQIYDGNECLQRNRSTEIRFWFLEMGIVLLMIILVCILVEEGDDSGILVLIGIIVGCGIQSLVARKHFGHGRQMGEIFQMISGLGSGEEKMESTIGEKSLYYPIAQQLCNIHEKVEQSAMAQVKSERMKVDLITNVSHDLKTPLTSVISYVDLLSKEELPAEAADYVAILKKKSARLESMIYNVFDIAKATSGNAKLDLTTLHMNKLLEQTLADMQDKVEESGFVLRKTLTQGDTAFVGDSGKMYRVCQNIIENALKYSLPGSRIFIRTTSDEDMVRLQIVNTSSYEMTFDEEAILERFTRGDDSRTTEGNGLGLSIAKSFTEACGGSFQVFVEGDQFKAVVEFPRDKRSVPPAEH